MIRIIETIDVFACHFGHGGRNGPQNLLIAQRLAGERDVLRPRHEPGDGELG